MGKSAIPSPEIGQSATGYVINTGFSEQNTERLAELQQKLAEQLPDSVWFQPADSTHVTLLDWVAPLVDYGSDKNALFADFQTQYGDIINRVFEQEPEISVEFTEVRASPKALFIVGEDDGSFQRLRETLLGAVELLPGTKPPPRIIHATIARFTETIDLALVAKAARSTDVEFTQPVTEFRLVKELVIPMLDYQVLERYPLH